MLDGVLNFKKWMSPLIAAVVMATVSSALAGPVLLSSVAAEYADSGTARLSKKLATRLGYDLEMIYAPFARRLVLMEEGRIDFAVGLYRLPERETYIHYVEPPYKKVAQRHFFLLKNSLHNIRSYEDLRHLKIGTKTGSKYFKRFDQDPRIKKFQVTTLEQNFEMLMLGRVDAVICSYKGGFDQARQMGMEDRVRCAPYFSREINPVYVGISKKSPLMSRKELMQQILQSLIDAGQL
ncbi:MAG: transporter substrate-binding domain-containing protein [Desulfobacterales bacterium]|nr:transporter substrate-binding domain-containing protein [Desulfobacterales bacterium]